MKTTVNIDDDLMKEAMKAAGVATKTEVIELGLREIIAARKRKDLANLFGKEKNISAPGRRRPA